MGKVLLELLEPQDKLVLQEVLEVLDHQDEMLHLVLQEAQEVLVHLEVLEVLALQEVLDHLDKMAEVGFMYKVQHHSFG